MKNHVRKSVFTMITLVWAVLLVPFAADLAEAQRLQRVSVLGVFDANGKPVGTADLSDENGVQVTFQVENLVFVLGATREGFIGGTLYFESANCDGTPYMGRFFEGSQLFLNVAVGPGNTTVYTPVPGASSELTIQSYFAGGSCHGPFSNYATLVPVQLVIDLSTLFTPPFNVQRIK